ncbi:hypothetical protein DL96DRAFT_1628646 [Flagelloscypha sp. PMI_526]|nr:hypothetical protein DL96DRAFT_1628646 [Flagelloscypha sp. PMI_526]
MQEYSMDKKLPIFLPPMMADGPSLRIPVELVERVIFYISDFRDLKRCCLASKLLTPLAQAKLFYRLRLPEDSDNSAPFLETMDSIVSTPHILSHVRSIAACHDHICLPQVLDALRKGALRDLALDGGVSWNWPSFLLRNLAVNVFPFLTSLSLNNIGIPLSMIMSCRCLTHLEVMSTELIWEKDLDNSRWINEKKGTLGYTTSYDLLPLPIERLGLDCTRDNKGDIRPLVELIADGRFPALVSLNIQRRASRGFPIEDANILMRPLMAQLRCLDIGYWDVFRPWKDANLLNSFYIGNYPQLLCFSFRSEHGARINHSMERRRQLSWLRRMCEALTEPHPLRVLTLHFTNPRIQMIRYVEFDASEGWKRFDQALQNTNLSSLSSVILPLGRYQRQLEHVFRRKFPRMNAVGKLSFEMVETSHYL